MLPAHPVERPGLEGRSGLNISFGNLVFVAGRRNAEPINIIFPCNNRKFVGILSGAGVTFGVELSAERL